MRDSFRLEQKIGMALFLEKIGQNYTEYQKRQATDPLNLEFHNIPVLKLSLVQQKKLLNPLLDKRAFNMVCKKEFFPEIIDFATQVNDMAKTDDKGLFRIAGNLNTHPLTRAIGFSDAVGYLKKIQALTEDNKGFLSYESPTFEGFENKKQSSKFTKNFLQIMKEKTRKYASYQLKTSRLMQKQNPEGTFLFDPTSMHMEQQTDRVSYLFQSTKSDLENDPDFNHEA